MIKIGLTGNIAAGKSEIEKIFNKLGVKSICADSIVHELFKKDSVKNEVISLFGKDILQANNIDRKKLGQIVFSEKEKKKALEKFIHPLVVKEINDFFEKNKTEKIVVADIPLLFESGLEYLVDKVILVYADDKIRLERIKTRNGFDEEHIKKIMDAQLSQEIKKEKSDFIIMNENKTLEMLEIDIKEIIEKLK